VSPTTPGCDDPITVLLVGDEPSAAEPTGELLERGDVRIDVEAVTGARDGLDRLARGDIDCVVSAYRLSGTDGIEFLDAVRERHPDLPFILFAEEGSEAVASEAVSAGATDYLRAGGDPDGTELLANRVRNAVERYRAEQRAAVLQRIRALATEVNQALVRAADRAEIESRVCGILSDASPYLFVWIGEHDPETGTVEARAMAGAERDYLDTVEITADGDDTGRGPTGRAVRTRETAVTNDVRTDEEYEPWREAALDRGYRSSAAVPLVYDDTLYGVLNVYADRPGAFDDRERDLLEGLGDDIAHAIHTQEVRQERRRRVARLEALFEQSPDMIDVHDADGTIVDANPMLAEKLGYPSDELVGKRVWEVDTTADPETTRATLAGMDSGDRIQVDGRFRRKDGSTFPVEVHVRRLDVADGDRFLVISRDITDRRERERKLRERTERLEEFAEVVSHDLRTPLSTARGYLDLARDDAGTDHLDRVARNLDRMERIVEDVLWLARSGDDIGSTGAVDLRELVEAAWKVVAGARTDAELVFVGEFEHIDADDDRLRQLVENLLGNALEHGGRDVTVRVEQLADGFAVADDGPGIPEEERARIFDAGYTVEEGTGVGLHIVKAIADAHGWDLTVTGTDGGGARFEVTGVDVVDV
jgi:PAS domain S-box-containing protein